MNNYYTLYSLVRELIYKIRGKKITEVWSHRKDQIDLFFDPSESGKLTFSASSPGTALFLDLRASKPSRNAVSFFPEICGCNVSGLELVSQSDRLIRMTFTDRTEELLFMPFSSRPNLFLVRDSLIISAFKDPVGQKGNPAPQPQSRTLPDRLLQPGQNSHLHSDSRQKGVEKKSSVQSPGDNRTLRENILAIDRQFPRGLLADVVDTCDLDRLPPEKLEKKILNLRSLLLQPDQVFLTAEGHLSLLPSSYLSHPPERSFTSINEAVRTLFLTRNRERRLLPRKKELEKRLSKRWNGWKKQIEQFKNREERLKKADRCEHYGHLLMSHSAPRFVPDSELVSLVDWSQEGKEIDIPVKAGITLMDQAKKYYDRASGIRKEITVSEKKEQELAERIGEAGRLLDELRGIDHPSELEKWLKLREDRLRKLGLTSSDKQPEARPYRLIPLGDYEVWVGKNAKSNDEMLTLSHKEDIWMHVRGASGSHLILRNRGQIGWPDTGLLLRAASWAAAWSRQAGSSLVPVMMAKRKHVRKPKGALPGQVTVTNERVEMVKPLKPAVDDS